LTAAASIAAALKSAALRLAEAREAAGSARGRPRLGAGDDVGDDFRALLQVAFEQFAVLTVADANAHPERRQLVVHVQPHTARGFYRGEWSEKGVERGRRRRRGRRCGIARRGRRFAGGRSTPSTLTTARCAGIGAALNRRRIEATRAHLFQHALPILW
jgi:hypothetical protein